ncbi:unnamed protein product [Ceutorhynchus assimilis]|uniref:Uncharacterized protein n=1 Tax=Ceutorhynchus assimilis TaxID=467358 RepID=A0A9N9N005_9CUCU|nr:unnamed protein product [Ceutorhynchus assimilis]
MSKKSRRTISNSNQEKKITKAVGHSKQSKIETKVHDKNSNMKKIDKMDNSILSKLKAKSRRNKSKVKTISKVFGDNSILSRFPKIVNHSILGKIEAKVLEKNMDVNLRDSLLAWNFNKKVNAHLEAHEKKLLEKGIKLTRKKVEQEIERIMRNEITMMKAPQK